MLASRLVAGVFVLSVVAFVVRATTPFVIADDWFYVAKLIVPWKQGRLKLADFFISRGPTDHVQPLYRLILLVQTEWFHMDFTFEAIVGVAFAMACVYLWYRLAHHELAKNPRAAIATHLIGLGMVAVIFSLNARGVFDWPLVALAFMGIFAVSVLLAATLTLAERPTALAIASLSGLTLLVFFVDDTYGILAVTCAATLLALMGIRRQIAPRAWISAVAAMVAVMVGYVVICHELFPYVGKANPGPGIAPMLEFLKGHWGEGFKLIVIPAGTPIATPQRLVQIFKASQSSLPWILGCLALPVCVANVWFWVNYLRRRPSPLSFTAAGLMLFFYMSLAAIVVARLPRFGFDYLNQGRYMQVYELQLVAVLMMSAQVLSERPDTPVGKKVLVVAVLALAGLTGIYAILVHREVPYIQSFQKRIAAQIEQFGSDPGSPPENCMANYVTPCANWSREARFEVFKVLEQGPYNVFSPTFRRWHRRQVPQAMASPDTPGPR